MRKVKVYYNVRSFTPSYYDDPHDDPDDPDAHSCSANADADGYCKICGAVVHGSLADYDLHSYDPPDTL